MNFGDIWAWEAPKRGETVVSQAGETGAHDLAAWMKIAQAREQAGEPEAALEAYMALLRSWPDHWPAREKAGVALAGLNRLDEAAKQFAAALDAPGQLPAATHLRLLVRLGNAFLRQERLADAEQALTQALDAHPFDLSATLALGSFAPSRTIMPAP